MASSNLSEMLHFIIYSTVDGTSVTYVLFCSGMLNRTMKYCSRWNTTVLVMEGRKTMTLTVPRCCYRICQILYHTVPRLLQSNALQSQISDDQAGGRKVSLLFFKTPASPTIIWGKMGNPST